MDDFGNSNTRVEKFKNTLLRAHGKDEKGSFFYSICYAICCLWTEKLLTQDDEKLAKDIPENLFQKLSASREEIVLNFRSQIF